MIQLCPTILIKIELLLAISYSGQYIQYWTDIIISIPMKQSLHKQIKQLQKDILRKKANILIEWVSFLYTSYHRCIITIIADKTFKQIHLSIADIEKFKNGANLLKDLQEGLLVCLVYREQKNTEVKINQQFFKLLPTLIQKIRAKIDPNVSHLKKLNGKDEIKVCKVCGTIRSQKQIQFIGQSCNCVIPTFVPIEKDEAKLAKLTLIQGMLNRVQESKGRIDYLHNEINKIYKAIDAINQREPTQYDVFLQKYGLNKVCKYKKTPEIVKGAEEYFRGMFTFRKIQEIAEIRAKRRRLDELMRMKKMEEQSCWFTEMVKREKQKKQQPEPEPEVPSANSQQKEWWEMGIKRCRTMEEPYFKYIRMYSYEPMSSSLQKKSLEEPINKKELNISALKDKEKRKQKYIKYVKQAYNELFTSIQESYQLPAKDKTVIKDYGDQELIFGSYGKQLANKMPIKGDNDLKKELKQPQLNNAAQAADTHQHTQAISFQRRQ